MWARSVARPQASVSSGGGADGWYEIVRPNQRAIWEEKTRAAYHRPSAKCPEYDCCANVAMRLPARCPTHPHFKARLYLLVLHPRLYCSVTGLSLVGITLNDSADPQSARYRHGERGGSSGVLPVSSSFGFAGLLSGGMATTTTRRCGGWRQRSRGEGVGWTRKGQTDGKIRAKH